MGYDDDDNDDEYPEYHDNLHDEPLTEADIWVLQYLSQMFANDQIFDFTSYLNNVELDHQLILQTLEHQDALVQGHAHPWALDQIMQSYHKHST
jgi:hypothetical protein